MKEENKAGILLLDDPFLTLDTERSLNAIKLLKIFQEQSGWQIVFFTKDLHTVDELRATFPDLQLHNLDLAGETRHLSIWIPIVSVPLPTESHVDLNSWESFLTSEAGGTPDFPMRTGCRGGACMCGTVQCWICRSHLAR